MLSFRKVRNENFIRLSQEKDILNIVCVHSTYKRMYLPNMNLFNCNSYLTVTASLGDEVMENGAMTIRDQNLLLNLSRGSLLKWVC